MYGRKCISRTSVLFECGKRLIARLEYDSRLESRRPLPESLGLGVFESYIIDDGFLVTIPTVERVAAPEGVVSTALHNRPTIGLRVVKRIGEGARYWIEGSRERKALKVNSAYLSSPSAIIKNFFPGGSCAHLFIVYIDPARLLNAAAGAGEFSARLERFFEEPDRAPRVLSSPIDTAGRRIISQIENRQLLGNLGRLFIEAKTLELCAILLSPYIVRNELVRVSAAENRKMDEVCDFIDSRLSDPPSLQEIARTIGVSVSKLKRDFRVAIGMGVHEYAIERRLETARAMIKEGSVSIKQASYIAGYRSSSYFSQLYKRRFGQLPNSEKRL